MKKLLVIAIIISNCLFVSYAGDVLPGDKDKVVSVTSLGITDGKVRFNCKYANTDGGKFAVELVDVQGNKLYKEIFTEKNFNKTFIASSDLGTIYLVITNMKDKSKHKYEISTEQRLVEEVLITSSN